MKKSTVISVLIFILLPDYSFSQKIDSANPSKIDSAKNIFYLKNAITLTNKGISYIPNLSLGKPAIIFDQSMGKRKLFFEPQLRFSLNGEPWAFLFSVRYKINPIGKFQMTAGLCPLLSFKNVTYAVNGVSITELVNRRYLGGELRPTYFIAKNSSVGVYYLYFRGINKGTLKNTNFVSVNSTFSQIKLGSSFFAKINAQFYYLNQDRFDGFYFNPVLTLLKKDFPFSVQSIMNKTIRTDIPGSEQFIWNVSLIYSFNKKYTPN